MATTVVRSFIIVGLGAVVSASCSVGASTAGDPAQSGSSAENTGTGDSRTTVSKRATTASGSAKPTVGGAGGAASRAQSAGGTSDSSRDRSTQDVSLNQGGASGPGTSTTRGGGGGSGGTDRTTGGASVTGSVAKGGASTSSPASPSGATTAGGSSTGGAASGDGMPAVYDQEDTGADCARPTSFPAFSALTRVANLPDPFLMESGTRIASRAEWRCRRAEISSQIQYWGSGPKGAPPKDVTATYSAGKLTVVVSEGSASITLSTTISAPSGSGPFPLLISVDGSGVPSSIFTSRGIATATFSSSQLVPSSMSVTRGAGTYFSIYPDKNTGAMIEWAWGISRLIDGLYKTVDQNKIDLKHIAVTGCSYAGKVSLYAGAFDERIALTIPEESGGGGEASWRVMATQTGTEDLEAAQGTAWYAANLKQFKNADAPKLPYDQHELVAMIAPRAVLTIGNTSIDRLGSEAGYVSMKAAAEVYAALGVSDRIGYSQNPTGTHCAFPNVQTADVAAFVDKFLLGKTGSGVTKSPYKTDLAKWITWSTPTLR